MLIGIKNNKNKNTRNNKLEMTVERISELEKQVSRKCPG